MKGYLKDVAMSRGIVFAVYCFVGIVGCVMSLQLIIKIALWLMPCFTYMQKGFYAIQTSCMMGKEWVQKQKRVYPIVIYDIPTAHVSTIENIIPYPASIVATAPVEIV